jgi:hypothetical protein
MCITVAALALALLPGIEIDHLLVKDPRYAAEAWLQAHMPPGGHVEIYQPAKRLPRFSPDLQVYNVRLEERTVEHLFQRRPDVIMLSSGGEAGLTGRRNPDWQLGDPLLIHSEPTKKLFELLRAEQLGYRRAAYFHTQPFLITPRIGSLNPEITIFARPEMHPEHNARAFN